MGMKRQTIGFDRKIQLDWLDATAEWVAQGRPTAEIRGQLEQLLEGKVAGVGAHSARGKTMTVLMHIWVLVPDTLIPLRDDGLAIIRGRSGRDRLTLHWGMCMATYPLFRDVASTTGRLLALQETATLSQIVRRMTESWGERSTLPRAVQRVVRSFVDWGVLVEANEPGIFTAAPKIAVPSLDGAWLMEAIVSASEGRGQPFRSLIGAPAFFPFGMKLTPSDLHGRGRLEIHRQGLDEDFVMLKEKGIR